MRSSPPAWYVPGRAHEAGLGDTERRLRGSHFTPWWLARALAERTVGRDTPLVVDPACGGGVFLLAALDRFVEVGIDPADALGRVRGFDVDPGALAAARNASTIWAEHHGVRDATIVPELRKADALVDDSSTPAGTVVLANPPFLDQLDAASARDRTRRDALDARFGEVAGAYTDEALLFVAWAVEAVGDGGAFAVILPRSALTTRDGAAVRDLVATRCDVSEAWFDDVDTFDAAVRTVALVGRRTGTMPRSTTVKVSSGRDFGVLSEVEAPTTNSWASLLGPLERTPTVNLTSTRTLGSLVEVIAGFRDEYYGLVPATHEHGEADREVDTLRLVTAGLIEPVELLWGLAPARFAKCRWVHPVISPTRIESESVRRWVQRVARPKVLVATQTRVVEAAVDVDGTTVGSTPTLNVIPADPDDVWAVLAVLTAPPVTAWMFGRTAGSALAPGALKVSADDIRSVPVPADPDLWQRGTAELRRAQEAADASDRRRRLLRGAALMGQAYRADSSVTEWWAERLKAAPASE